MARTVAHTSRRPSSRMRLNILELPRAMLMFSMALIGISSPPPWPSNRLLPPPWQHQQEELIISAIELSTLAISTQKLPLRRFVTWYVEVFFIIFDIFPTSTSALLRSSIRRQRRPFLR